MANETYTLIQKTTLNASAASITFSSIPQTFTDLVVKVSARGTTSALYGYLYVKLNSAVTNYSGKLLYADNATAGSTAGSATILNPGLVTMATSTESTFASSEFYIPNYTSANYKSISSDAAGETNSTHAMLYLTGQLWSNTAAVTSIDLSPDSGNFAQYTSASLYGVAKQGVTAVAGPKATGGDIITNDGTYWIHQFLNSGTFTPSQTLSTEYLVVAGGGGGGWRWGGGGGAGGYKTASGFSVTAGTSYTATVGAGGAGTPTNGSNSVFSTITSTGGGKAGGQTSEASAVGGSGGGGSASFSPSNGTGSEGNAGGTGTTAGGYATGGGGGGASAAGTNSGVNGGAGGAGTANSISGSSVTYAGGGGGSGDDRDGTHNIGAGGTGGGGAGSTNTTAPAGTVNTGGGGGGTGNSSTAGGAGGSGIVIIRYAM